LDIQGAEIELDIQDAAIELDIQGAAIECVGLRIAVAINCVEHRKQKKKLWGVSSKM
jgi:tartrate dehydratase alpha subunit/fumarate hydratase class I-like protein